MAKNKPQRLWIGVAIVGVVALMMVLVLSLRDRNSAEPASPDRPSEFQASSAERWFKPGKDLPVYEIAAKAGQAAQHEAEAIGLPAPEGLADRVRERIELILFPEFQVWVELAHAAGVDLSSMFDRQGELIDPQAMNAYLSANESLKGAPTAAETITIRRIQPDTPITMGVPGTRFMRGYSQGSTAIEYPQPPKGDPSLVLAEALVPVKFKSVGSSTHDLPATFTIRLYRTDSRPDWQPYDFMLYFDEASMGKELTFPIF